jgi:hypothetical protein
MKPRRVILTLEVETDAPVSYLRNRTRLVVAVKMSDAYGWHYPEVLQAQANVVKTERPATKRKAKR